MFVNERGTHVGRPRAHELKVVVDILMKVLCDLISLVDFGLQVSQQLLEHGFFVIHLFEEFFLFRERFFLLC